MLSERISRPTRLRPRFIRHHLGIRDSVELTGAVEQIAGLQADIASIVSVDMGKVTEIREAIANGSYKIDAKSIAQSLLALEADLA